MDTVAVIKGNPATCVLAVESHSIALYHTLYHTLSRASNLNQSTDYNERMKMSRKSFTVYRTLSRQSRTILRKRVAEPGLLGFAELGGDGESGSCFAKFGGDGESCPRA